MRISIFNKKTGQLCNSNIQLDKAGMVTVLAKMLLEINDSIELFVVGDHLTREPPSKQPTPDKPPS